MAAKLSWQFPLREFFVMRVEIVTILTLAFIIFLASILGSKQGLLNSLVLGVGFVLLYFTISYLVQQARKVEEYYHLTPEHLEVIRKTAKKTKKVKVYLKDVVLHKLDHRFLGGYLVTKKGVKHLLFFNTKAELKKFERMIKKHMKSTLSN